MIFKTINHRVVQDCLEAQRNNEQLFCPVSVAMPGGHYEHAKGYVKRVTPLGKGPRDFDVYEIETSD